MTSNRAQQSEGISEEKSFIKAGTIQVTIQPEAKDVEPTVAVNIGDGLSLFVPKSLTVSVLDGKRTYPALVTIPVRCSRQVLYDLPILLEQRPPGSEVYIPDSVAFDQETFTRKTEFFSQILAEKQAFFNAGYYPDAVALLKSLASPAISREQASQVRIGANQCSLAIQDLHSDLHGESIAVDVVSRFGPHHRQAISDSVFTMAISEGINVMLSNTPGIFTPFNGIMIPICALVPNIQYHPPINGQWCHMNRRGLPTFLLYSAAAATTWVSCVLLEGICATKMNEQGYSDTAIRFSTGAVSIGVAITTRLAFTYGPSVTTFSNAAKKAGTCLNGVGALLKACGMKFWNCRRNNDSSISEEQLLASRNPKV